LLIVFPAIVGLGIYWTLKLRLCRFPTRQEHFLSDKKEKGDEGSISRFGAISAVLAGNFGTGNISGMAVAIATGGPGALVGCGSWPFWGLPSNIRAVF